MKSLNRLNQRNRAFEKKFVAKMTAKRMAKARRALRK